MPIVPFRNLWGNPLGTGEGQRRMERTTTRSGSCPISDHAAKLLFLCKQAYRRSSSHIMYCMCCSHVAALTNTAEFRRWQASKAESSHQQVAPPAPPLPQPPAPPAPPAGIFHKIAHAIRSLQLAPLTRWLLAVSAAALVGYTNCTAYAWLFAARRILCTHFRA